MTDPDTTGRQRVQHLLRSATLTGFPELARSLGCDPAGLVRRVGLDVADLAVPDRWIPAAPVARLLDLCAREAQCEDFGLRMSEFRRFSTLGPISVVIAQEPDLRSALDVLCEYEHTYNGALELRRTESGDQAAVEVWLELGEPAPTRQGLDLALAALIGAIRELVRGDWEPSWACFSHPAPAHLDAYRQVFGPQLRFDEAFTGLVFPAGDLDLPVVTSDPSLQPYALRFLRATDAGRPGALVEQVRGLMELLLPTRRCSVDQVSRCIGLTPRTLNRRLAGQGTSFSALLHETRGSMAERSLANERYSVTQVSGLLGFDAPSAFSRWFRQRFGMSPSEWRSSSRLAG